MRLIKLKIGSSKASPTHQFKNLKDVAIDFDENQWVTVVIGWNGTGKSNVLEALAIIFREFLSPRKSPKVDFSFLLEYYIGSDYALRKIQIHNDPDNSRDKFTIFISRRISKVEDGLNEIGFSEPERVRLSRFLDEPGNLPKYVFSYYSGESMRMHDIFAPYLQWYDDKLRKGEDPGAKQLFYALPVHSQFVLLAFLLGENLEIGEFLNSSLGLDPNSGLESVLFVLRQPPWRPQEGGDARFWGAKGIVSDFLSRLQDIALAPIQTERRVSVSLWNKETLQFKYLYIKDLESLRKLAAGITPAEFFRDLESTYVSQLIEEVRIKVKLSKTDETVTFRELSEGEQQLITVLGLIKFTAEEESLFLLDEPDTHLNPRWSVDYLKYLRQIVVSSAHGGATSHILLTTHNPLAIAELVKEQVQILQLSDVSSTRKVIAMFPEVDPRGMGYAAIVSSDMFGIASTLDHSTQVLLEKQRILGAKSELSDNELTELEVLNGHLNRLGFRFFHPDDEYSRYLRIRNSKLEELFKTKDVNALSELVVKLDRKTREEFAQDLVNELLPKEN